MRVLTADFGLPFLAGFMASVAACSVANLLASEYWAFRGRGRRRATSAGGPVDGEAPAATMPPPPAVGSARRRQVVGLAVMLAGPALAGPNLHAAADDQRQARQEGFATYMTRSDAAALERVNGTRPFLWLDERPDRRPRARAGGIVIEPTNREPASDVPHGLVHDWIGAVFIPGARVDEVIRLVQDYDRHEIVYAPEVVDARLIGREGQHFVAFMRFRRVKIITVILDTVHDAHYAKLDDTRWHSRSVTTSVYEVDRAGERGERRLPADEGHGFMLNLNTFWRFAEADGGVYVECQAVSLSRRIPTGLGWLLRPMVYSLPRESLSHTLAATRAALAAQKGAGRR
jgi:hypothetical protein